MNTILHKLSMLFISAGLLMAGCSKSGSDNDTDSGSGNPKPDPTPEYPYVTVRQSDYESEDNPTTDEDQAIELQACLFEAGRMVAIYDKPETTADGYGFRLDRETDGTFYVVTKASGMPNLKALLETGITEENWLATTVGTENGLPIRFFSGHTTIASTENPTVTLTRGVARFDMHLRVAGDAEIERLTITNAAQHTALFTDTSFTPTELGEITFDFPTPCTQDTPGVAYVYGQSGTKSVLRADAVINGKRFELEAEVPETIRPNHIYIITVRKDDIYQEAQLTVEPWEAGDDVELRPDFDGRITVDREASILPSEVTVSDDLSMVTLPYGATELTLALDCNNELELQPVTEYPLTIEPVTTRGVPGHNTYRISKPLYAPGMPADEVVLQFRRKGLDELYVEDQIHLHLSANPTQIEGEPSFDTESYSYDFGRYVDNELARLTLAEGKSLSVEFDTDEDPWVKIVPVEDVPRTYRVLGGWRPNDPSANGRIQSARLVITDDNNTSIREEYNISRRNYGLPVTWFHGVWWCKYNARGNSHNFEDQVLCSNDPAAAAGKSVFDYLTTCSPEEFYDLWGWVYQGGSGSGMRIVESEGRLVADGFSSSETVHINKLPADALAPDGYELPSMEEFNRMFDATDYVWVMWSGTHTLRNPWEGHSQVKREQRRRNDVTIGNVQAKDLLYMKMWSPDFTNYESVTWYGPAAQWNTDGILHSEHYNNILFSVYSPEGSGWYFSGAMNALYLQKNGAGTKDTRILRFKKSPVEYIYGE